jgi:hypothetical protein
MGRVNQKALAKIKKQIMHNLNYLPPQPTYQYEKKHKNYIIKYKNK